MSGSVQQFVRSIQSYTMSKTSECPACGSTAFDGIECEDCGTNYQQALLSISAAMQTEAGHRRRAIRAAKERGK